jgi:hypothetical protein
MTMDRPMETHGEVGRAEMDLTTLLMLVFLLTAGITLLAVTALYVHDLETLANLPGMVWNFLCGQPNEGGVTLPALTLVTLITFAAAITIYGRWRLTRR